MVNPSVIALLTALLLAGMILVALVLHRRGTPADADRSDSADAGAGRGTGPTDTAERRSVSAVGHEIGEADRKSAIR